MKTVLIAPCILIAVLACVVVGCRMFAKRSTEATVPLAAKPEGKIAIVYFSQSKVGNTALAAKWIQKHAGGDLVPLEPAAPYPEPYGETLKAANAERAAGTHPPLKPFPPLEGYDIVFIGSPIWYGTYAAPLATFFDGEKFAGKTVVPFCTHGGGGAGRFFDDVRKACPAAKVLDGLALRGSNQIERRLDIGVSSHHTEDDVVEWLNRIFKEQTGIKEKTAMNDGIYQFTVKGRKGEDVPLADYKGKVLLVVNTATRCGFTPQYEGLEAMYERVKGRGFELLDFPCNQFGGQAPGTEEEIHTFCVLNYKTAFPQFAKVEVNGENAAPLFKFLTANTKFEGFPQDGKIAPILEKMLGEADPDYAKKSSIKWNFTKFLIGRDGRVIKRFEPTAPLAQVEAAIENALAERN